MAEYLVALATDKSSFAAFVKCCVAIATDDHTFFDHTFAIKTGCLVARFTVVTVFAFFTECCFAPCTPDGLFTVVAECLLALSTVERFFAMKTQ